METKYIILWIIIGGFIGYLIAKIHFWQKMKNQKTNAIKRSKSIVLWQINEQIAPLLPSFPYDYKDAVFLGKGVDYIIFDGLGKWNLKEIVFLEVKSNKSNLNRNEKYIKDCISRKNIQYKIMRI